MYVCLGSKIPWICKYITKIPSKIYICLGSKIPKKKQTKTNKNKKYIFRLKSQHAFEKK